jgi:translation elongation factor aEF-1 beta
MQFYRTLEGINMGQVVALIRIMPGEVISDVKLEKIKEEVIALIKPPVKLGRIEIKDIAFGLKGLNLTVLTPDKEGGGLDPLVEIISKVDNVDSVEIVDVGLL